MSFYLRTVWLGTVLCVFSIVFFFPGYMHPDIFRTLTQIAAKDFDDRIPALYTSLWIILDSFGIQDVKFGVVVIQNIIFWSGLTALSLQNRKYSILFLGLFPPIFSSLGTAWKDILFSGVMIWIVVVLNSYLKTKSRSWLCLIFFLFLSSVLIRYNGFFSIIPFILYMLIVLSGDFIFEKKKKVLFHSVAIVGFIFCVLISSFSIKRIFNIKNAYPSQQIMFYDLSYLSLKNERLLFPGYLKKKEQRHTQIKGIRENFTARYNWNLFKQSEKTGIQWTSNKNEYDSLMQQWLKGIAQNPFNYLRFRYQVLYNHIIKPYYRNSGSVFIPVIGVDDKDLQAFNIKYEKLEWKMSIQRILNLFGSIFYSPIIYISISGFLVSLYCCRAKNFHHISMLTFLSGLFYCLGYFIFGVDSSYRMNHWTVLASILSLLFLPIDYYKKLYLSLNKNKLFP